MKRCNQCGTIVKDEARFCPNCGMSYFSSYDNGQTVSLNHEQNLKKEDDHKDTDDQKTVYHGKTTYEETGESDHRYESGYENTGTKQDTGAQRDNSDCYGTFSSQRYSRSRQSTYSGQKSSDNPGNAGYQQNAHGGGNYSGRNSYTQQQKPEKSNVKKIVLCILAVVVLVWAILVLLLVTDTGEVRFFGFINSTEEISEEEMLDGTWSGYGDFSYAIYQSLIGADSELAQYFENVSLSLPIIYTFHYSADGVSTWELSTDEEIVSQSIQEWYLEGMEPYLADVLVEIAQCEHATRDF